MHAEPINEEGFAFSKDHFKKLINAAKSLNVNFIRAAHYPYTRHLAKLCDEAGILLWEEIPVYWNINWANAETEAVAESMLSQLIKRDWNRASIVIWSLGNETPFSPERMKFMLNQKQTATTLDSSRLISAALLSGNAEQFRSLVYFLAKEGMRHDFVLPEEKVIFKNIVGQMESLYQDYDNFFININDPLAEYLDIIAYNEYFGWYYTSFLVDQIGVRESTLRQLMFKIMPTIKIKSEFNKPIHISEFGAGAKINYPYKDQIWSEEYQNKVYEHQLEMIKNNPQIQGISPWILKDFRSMMRPLADVQDYYNRKGLIDERGRKKRAFDTLADFYAKEW
jgi:beta-glucuronidase